MIRPWVLKVLAVVLALYTFMVVWSECLFFVKEPVLSLFAVFINLAKTNYDYFSIEVRIVGINRNVFDQIHVPALSDPLEPLMFLL